MNPRDITVTLKPVSNMENVIEIKSGLLHLGKEGVYNIISRKRLHKITNKGTINSMQNPC